MAFNLQEQDQLREEIFAEVTRLADEKGGFFTFQELLNFELNGVRIPLASQKGINNPQIFDATLSVVSAADGPYDDHVGPNGLLRYKFEAGDPRAGSNRKLLVAMSTKTPIILFERPMTNVYVPFVGAFVIDADYEQEFVTIAVDRTMSKMFDVAESEIERRYVTAEVQRRVHQPVFRARVISAYQRKCAICRLAHVELLDAAHIISDKHDDGLAIVPNGLSLCKIHHAAYDRNLLGIDPNFVVHIDEELLIEIDGPMLQHGLKDMHLSTMNVPSQNNLKPDRDRLAQRFELFMA